MRKEIEKHHFNKRTKRTTIQAPYLPIEKHSTARLQRREKQQLHYRVFEGHHYAPVSSFSIELFFNSFFVFVGVKQLLGHSRLGILIVFQRYRVWGVW